MCQRWDVHSFQALVSEGMSSLPHGGTKIILMQHASHANNMHMQKEQSRH